MTSKNVLPEKVLLEKAAVMKRFEYLLLDKELKSKMDIANKQYQTLHKMYEIDEAINTKATLKNYSTSDLVYEGNYSFYKNYRDTKKLDKLSLKSKHLFLATFIYDLDKITKLKTQKERTQKKKINVYNKATELYSDFPSIYFNEYSELSDDKRKK